MFQENSIETRILSRVKQITSPGWVHETSARAWCTGKTQRDRVEREAPKQRRSPESCLLPECDPVTNGTTIKGARGPRCPYSCDDLVHLLQGLAHLHRPALPRYVPRSEQGIPENQSHSVGSGLSFWESLEPREVMAGLCDNCTCVVGILQCQAVPACPGPGVWGSWDECSITSGGREQLPGACPPEPHLLHPGLQRLPFDLSHPIRHMPPLTQASELISTCRAASTSSPSSAGHSLGAPGLECSWLYSFGFSSHTYKDTCSFSLSATTSISYIMSSTSSWNQQQHDPRQFCPLQVCDFHTASTLNKVTSSPGTPPGACNIPDDHTVPAGRRGPDPDPRITTTKVHSPPWLRPSSGCVSLSTWPWP
nr:unnamed protein product [Rangifer tarandus platyrhynchus]